MPAFGWRPFFVFRRNIKSCAIYLKTMLFRAELELGDPFSQRVLLSISTPFPIWARGGWSCGHSRRPLVEKLRLFLTKACQ
ncbi:MAG TPA: hypothetical protein VG347_08390 [Verrucomicrobiae bacterium]|nr:hypothetical protein [Verrucomicrobiae bacterium]